MSQNLQLSLLLAQAATEMNAKMQGIADRELSPAAIRKCIEIIAEGTSPLVDEAMLTEAAEEARVKFDTHVSELVIGELEQAMLSVAAERVRHTETVTAFQRQLESELDRLARSRQQEPSMAELYDASEQMFRETGADVAKAYVDFHLTTLRFIFLGRGVSEETTTKIVELLKRGS